MGKRDDGLGLSLSLGLISHQKEPSLRMNLMPMASSPHMQNLNNNPQRSHNPWTHLFQSSDRTSELRLSLMRGIDVNSAPSPATAEEDGGASSPNSTVSSLSGKRVGGADDIDGERASCSRGGSDEEDGGNGDGSRKKLRLTKEQSLVLEETFKEHSSLNPKQKLALAKQLNLRPRQVEVWFQNRRARTKLKQTEVDCEYLKRCCENLTDENRRLQKEVAELRALKLSPHLYMTMSPPTTLTMCPSCERVAVPSSAAAPHSAGRLDVVGSRPHRLSTPVNSWAGVHLRERPAT
ncbi:PREDICTED: homeobox-leucine zipper protein HAT3-like [Tarenaya hassleriana]|uniref:homeobox-leucine zipper protein HAT3-like n=1 Tax=Tarenaya hassleriana TaxID=28532 RepID=UPI00053C7FF8|nr:PREDICTED: homeobox-leucine zipper protein HAT3-like [Tarenaya hassleriana]